MSSELLLAEREIEMALGRFARACDDRDWAAFETVFAPDVTVDFPGFFAMEGRDAVIANIRSLLGGCGPSQHLIGNFVVTAAGKSAESRCYTRAFHAGLGDRAAVTYEVMGEYHAHWRRLSEGWRVTEWVMKVRCELGDRSILGPAVD
jgi:hypothetical protein